MAVTQYIGSRYVPLFADPIEWDKTKEYEPLTIVSYQGNSYTSRQAVPTNIEITNEKYWALTGNYNAQVESYRSEVKNYQGQVTQAVEDVETKLAEQDSKIQAQISEQDASIKSQIAEQKTDITNQLSTQDSKVTTQLATNKEYVDTEVGKVSNYKSAILSAMQFSELLTPHSQITAHQATVGSSSLTVNYTFNLRSGISFLYDLYTSFAVKMKATDFVATATMQSQAIGEGTTWSAMNVEVARKTWTYDNSTNTCTLSVSYTVTNNMSVPKNLYINSSVALNESKTNELWSALINTFK